MSMGIPGHCFDADFMPWHEPGKCKGAILNCDGKCCSADDQETE